jgi:hypothetical protein
MNLRPAWFRRSALHLIGAFAACACSGPPSDQIFVPNPPPYNDAFDAVSDALEAHCGTTDCHGNSARNLRVYGIDGLRDGRGLFPGSALTTPHEYEDTYSSLIALQPEVLTQVVADHGARPERWMVITKGRGTEHHKGGSRMQPGDDTDHCITSWLTLVVDQGACSRASSITPPGGPGF